MTRNRHLFARLIVAALFITGCKSTGEPVSESDTTLVSSDQSAAGDGSFKKVGGPVEVAPLFPLEPIDFARNAKRPRWSPDGRALAFYAGEEGSRRIYVTDGKLTRELDLGEGDFIDPTFSRDGTRLVYAAKTDDTKGYDIFVVALDDGEPERVTTSAGDETEPVVNPLIFGFYAVQNGICGGKAYGTAIDGYEKVYFTHRAAEAPRTIRYTSLEPTSADDLYRGHWRDDTANVSPHGAHAGGVTTPADGDCHSPAFSADGLSALWTCDARESGAAKDGTLRYDTDFQTAIDALDNPGCPFDFEKGWTEDDCLAELPKHYSTVETRRSVQAAGLGSAGYSANQIELLASVGGQPMMARRVASPSLSPAKVDVGDAQVDDLAWSPDGRMVAYTERGNPSTVRVATIDAYLRDVRNLDDFPELWKTESELLANNRFVARPSAEKEYYVAYEKTRYQDRPLFITADVALQVFRDEFQLLIQRAEEVAAEDLRQMSKDLMTRFAKASFPGSRYLALYFATAWVPLESVTRLPQPTFDELMANSGWTDATEGEPGRPPMDELMKPVAERLPSVLDEVIRDVPKSIRSDVRANAEAAYAARTTGKLPVPGFARPVGIDWTQMRPRGSYAESKLAGYFYAMNWFGQAPLPFARQPLDALDQAMRQGGADGETWRQRWTRTDALVGAFMGKPGAATLTHLDTARRDHPDAWKTFDPQKMSEILEELRGEVLLRDLDAAQTGADSASLKIMLFPKRVGLDTTFFRRLVHPDVEQRYTPSSLEPMAILGSERATKHLLEKAAGAPYFDAYKAALSELDAKHGALETTDIYHAWLAVLVSLADDESVEVRSALHFARTDAWRDRLLHSALAGYVQLKHAAVLYNMQDMGIECDGDERVFLLSERPVIPEPSGSVDPVPAFFGRLADLGERVQKRLSPERAPSVDFYGGPDAETTNAVTFARDLQELALKVRAGKPLTAAEEEWIRATGGRLEALLLRTLDPDQAMSTGPNARVERGVAIATDIHTRVTSRQVLQIAVGRLLTMWVIVPNEGPGSRLTEGHIASFYEFLHPMSDRLTDARWNDLLADSPPERPDWTESFIEADPGQ